MMEKDTDRLETPHWLFDHYARIFRFTIDACASAENALVSAFWTRKMDAVLQDWTEEVVWCNPPYSNPGPFLQAAASARAAVCLVKGDPSVKWWNSYVTGKASVIWIPKRVKFLLDGKPTPYTASFPSAILLYGMTPPRK